MSHVIRDALKKFAGRTKRAYKALSPAAREKVGSYVERRPIDGPLTAGALASRKGRCSEMADATDLKLRF